MPAQTELFWLIYVAVSRSRAAQVLENTWNLSFAIYFPVFPFYRSIFYAARNIELKEPNLQGV